MWFRQTIRWGDAGGHRAPHLQQICTNCDSGTSDHHLVPSMAELVYKVEQRTCMDNMHKMESVTENLPCLLMPIVTVCHDSMPCTTCLGPDITIFSDMVVLLHAFTSCSCCHRACQLLHVWAEQRLWAWLPPPLWSCTFQAPCPISESNS